MNILAGIITISRREVIQSVSFASVVKLIYVN